MTHKKIIILVYLIIQTFVIQTNAQQVYFNVESQKLNNKKVVKSNYEVLINCDNSEMIMHYYKPTELYVFTNKLGEMKAYYPKKNEVVRHQNMIFSSNNEVILQFFTNKAQDLGLSELGFSLQESDLDKQFLVTKWLPPVDLLKNISLVTMVQENYLPIFVSFASPDENIKQKIYFSEWQSVNIAVYPQRITQIDFLPNNDSIISKKTYKNMITGSAAEKKFAPIDIPSNAKLIDPLKQKN